jgi:uncharacterized repeat protein (TIGR01451 family)
MNFRNHAKTLAAAALFPLAFASIPAVHVRADSPSSTITGPTHVIQALGTDSPSTIPVYTNVNQALKAEEPIFTTDFSVSDLSGPTTVKAHQTVFYTVAIHNNGLPSAANAVNVRLGVTGGLQPGLSYANVTQSPLTFECSEIATGIDCNYGTLAAGEAVTITFPVYASEAGTGTVWVLVNPQRNVTESDYSNDFATMSVTVN